MPAPKRAPPLPPEYEEIEVSDRMGSLIETGEAMRLEAETVTICRYDPAAKSTDFLDRIPVEEFSFEYVRDEYGGGIYPITYHSEKGKIVKRDVFRVAPQFKGRWTKARASGPPQETPVEPARAVDPQTIILQAQIETLKAFAQTQGEMMKGLFAALVPAKKDGEEKPAFTPPDPIAMIEKLASTMKSLTPEPPAQPPSVFDAKTMGEMFREGLEVGKMAANPDEGFGKIAETLVPKVVDVLDQASKKEGLKGVKGQPQLKPGAPAPAREQPQVNVQAAPWLAHLRPFVNEIAAWAQAGYDPEAYAISLAARLPENVLDEIELASRDAQFVEKAITALPAPFQAYRAWLTGALEALKEQVQPEPQGPGRDDDDEPGGGGE